MMHVHYDFSLVLGSIVVALLACFLQCRPNAYYFVLGVKNFKQG